MAFAGIRDSARLISGRAAAGDGRGQVSAGTYVRVCGIWWRGRWMRIWSLYWLERRANAVSRRDAKIAKKTIWKIAGDEIASGTGSRRLTWESVLFSLLFSWRLCMKVRRGYVLFGRHVGDRSAACRNRI